MTAHWGIADPAAVEGTDVEKATAFRKAFKELETRIKLLISLPIGALDSMTLQARLRGPNGCPWDREQTHASLRKFLIELGIDIGLQREHLLLRQLVLRLQPFPDAFVTVRIAPLKG